MNLMELFSGAMDYLWTAMFPFENRRDRKTFLLVLYVLAFQILPVQFSKVDYCKPDLQCKEGEKIYNNSACGCPAPDRAACGMTPTVRMLSSEEATHVVDRHNFYRNNVASGKENRSGNFGATDIMAMVYNKDLEYTAYCYSFKCNEEHDKCRITEQFKSPETGAGQNQFAWYDGKPCDKTTINEALTAWYEEVKLIPTGNRSDIETFSCITKMNCDLHTVGHYTQVVWSSTTDVGCAFMHYNKSHAANDFSIACNIFCNYGPAGNVEGTRIYTLGRPARDCKTTHKTYTRLCTGEKPKSGEHDFTYYGVTTIISPAPLTMLLMLLLVFLLRYCRCVC